MWRSVTSWLFNIQTSDFSGSGGDTQKEPVSSSCGRRGTWPVTIAMSLKSTCRTSMIFLFLSFLLLSLTKLCDALSHFGKAELFCSRDLLFTPTVAERLVTTLIYIHAAGTYAQRHKAGSVWRGEVFVWNVLTRRPLRNAP